MGSAQYVGQALVSVAAVLLAQASLDDRRSQLMGGQRPERCDTSHRQIQEGLLPRPRGLAIGGRVSAGSKQSSLR